MSIGEKLSNHFGKKHSRLTTTETGLQSPEKPTTAVSRADVPDESVRPLQSPEKPTTVVPCADVPSEPDELPSSYQRLTTNRFPITEQRNPSPVYIAYTEPLLNTRTTVKDAITLESGRQIRVVQSPQKK